LQDEQYWANAWGLVRTRINPEGNYDLFDLYLTAMPRVFAAMVGKAVGLEDPNSLEALSGIAGDALVTDLRPNEFAKAIAEGDRGQLLSYAHTRLGRFL